MDFGRIQHVENLGDARLDAAFALARRDPHRPAEQLEKVVRRFVVPQIDGPAAARDAAEFLADTGRLANGVEQNLRIESAEQGTRIVLLVALVRRVRFRGELIGSRRGDRADQPVQVVLMFDKRRLASASSNSGLDGGLVERKSSTGSTMPRPRKWPHIRLTRSASQPGIVRRRHPIGEDRAAVARRRLAGSLRSQRTCAKTSSPVRG